MGIFKEQARESFQIVFDKLESLESRVSSLETVLNKVVYDLGLLKDLLMENQVKLAHHERELNSLQQEWR